MNSLRALFPGNDDAALRHAWDTYPASFWCDGAKDAAARVMRARSAEFKAMLKLGAHSWNQACRWKRGKG